MGKITDLMNPVKIIEFIFNFTNGVVEFMQEKVNIPGIGNVEIWTLFISFLVPILLYLLVKRLFL